MALENSRIDLDAYFYTPQAAHWFGCWRKHVHQMKQGGQDAWAYSQAAALAQAMYVIALALKI